MINLNEVEVKINPVFNNGNAGEALAKIKVVRKQPTDKPNFPDWKVSYFDQKNRELNDGFYYLDPSKYASDEKFKNRLNYEALRLKHMVNALYGDEFEFPVFATPKEMLDGCMELLQAKNGTTVKVGATYGTTKRPSKNGWIQVKSTFPFILGDLSKEISFSNSDLLERPTPSSTPADSQKSEEKLPWDQ